MARILCSKSGVLFQCEHLPISLQSNESHHPFFNIPQKRLISLAGDWARNSLTHTESYLLYLSLLNSTDLIIWRTAARVTPKTQAIIASNMESLFSIVGKINLISHPSFNLPKFAITYDTGSLENSFYWIQAWIAGYNEFMSDQKDLSRREAIKGRLERRETSLEKLIKTAFASPTALANHLAAWAIDAGDFPDYLTPHPLAKRKTDKNSQVPLSDYWAEIIRACANDEAIWRYPQADLEELITHCEDNIQHGTIFARKLMVLLRTGLQKHKDFAGFGDVDLAGRKTSFTLLNEHATVEDANVMAIIQSAPQSEPRRENYPSAFAYMKARANWELAQKYGSGTGGVK